MGAKGANHFQQQDKDNHLIEEYLGDKERARQAFLTGKANFKAKQAKAESGANTNQAKADSKGNTPPSNPQAGDKNKKKRNRPKKKPTPVAQ